MKVIHSRNVNEAYAIGMNALFEQGVHENSRCGDVLVMPEPVATTYTHSTERVIFNINRDANPFFHLMEGLWMLAGRNDVEWIGTYNSSFHQFSDDGKTFNAAYGYRWRKQFNRDQIAEAITMLKKDETTRRCVVSMWDPYADFNEEGKDFPCNLNIHFLIRDKKLTMTVFNRSNDVIWGAYGANVVHMSMLQEYVASMLDIEIGFYTQVSNNFHAYKNVLDTVGIPDPHPMDPYERGDVFPLQMVTHKESWMDDLIAFMEGQSKNRIFKNSFFIDVVLPMSSAWKFYKRKKYISAIGAITDNMPDYCDWKIACRAWLIRKAEKNATKDS